MSRFQHLFLNQSQPVLIPYFVLGYPNPQACFRAIQAALDSGVQALELGIAFSDPLADGPVIQQATSKVIQQGFTTTEAFELIERIRGYSDCPIGLLLYGNTVEHMGINQCFERAKEAGVDAVLIADVPLAESNPYNEAAQKVDLDRVFLATPSADTPTLSAIAQQGSGFTYVVTRRGVTGVQNPLQLDHLRSQIDTLKELNAPPTVMGFGISQPHDVSIVAQAGAKGYIIGSKCVEIMGKMSDDQILEGCQPLTSYLGSMSLRT